ncbi:MAG: CoA transferase [Acidobacteria bacterium]|nr:CoA transferase [Acidobacteriota bacterium]
MTAATGVDGFTGAVAVSAVDLMADALGRAGADPQDAMVRLTERGLLDRPRATTTISANGSCRLLSAADAPVAVNLPRPDDLDLLAAWLDVDAHADATTPWDAIAVALAARPAQEVVATAQELGLAVAMVPRSAVDHVDAQLEARGTLDPSRPFLRTVGGGRVATRSMRGVRVVDLSSLWAGPLCSRLLADAGAEVIKVESTTRPDGLRVGDAPMFERLHQGKTMVSVPFHCGSEPLRSLLASADVVIEGSRPRALERLGIDPAAVVAARPGAVWVSITAYGRTGPWRNRVGFGDDTAAAAGLLDRSGEGASAAFGFVGDAIADPLTGAVAAALVVDAVAAGGGLLLDVALREVARTAALGASVAW